MENTSERRIELHIDPTVKTVRIIACKVTCGELIECYVDAAAAVAAMIAKNADDVDHHMAIDIITAKFMQRYLDSDDDGGADNGND